MKISFRFLLRIVWRLLVVFVLSREIRGEEHRKEFNCEKVDKCSIEAIGDENWSVKLKSKPMYLMLYKKSAESRGFAKTLKQLAARFKKIQVDIGVGAIDISKNVKIGNYFKPENLPYFILCSSAKKSECIIHKSWRKAWKDTLMIETINWVLEHTIDGLMLYPKKLDSMVNMIKVLKQRRFGDEEIPSLHTDPHRAHFKPHPDFPEFLPTDEKKRKKLDKEYARYRSSRHSNDNVHFRPEL